MRAHRPRRARRRRRHRLPRRRHRGHAGLARRGRRARAAAARARRSRVSTRSISLADGAARASSLSALPDARFISALTGEGVDELLATLGDAAAREPVPLSRRRDQHRSRFASSSRELVRETALEQLDDEVPYSVACEIEEFRESAVAGVHSGGAPRRARQPEAHPHRRRRAAHPRRSDARRARRSKQFVGAARLPRPVGQSASELADATRTRCAASAISFHEETSAMTLVAATARDSRLPQVQGRARVPRGRIGARLPFLPASLRDSGRHSDHADRRGDAALRRCHGRTIASRWLRLDCPGRCRTSPHESVVTWVTGGSNRATRESVGI